MPFKAENSRIEIQPNLSGFERIITVVVGYVLFYVLVTSPHSVFKQATKETDSSFPAMLPGLIAGAVFLALGIAAVYKGLRKPKPEVILLNEAEVRIEFGTYSILDRGKNPDKDIGINLYILNREEIKSITIRHFRGGNELTFDKGKKRVRFGIALTEAEREKLFDYIKPIQGGA